MELSERFIRTLEEEYPSVYEEQDAPDFVHPIQTNTSKMSVYITDGSLIFDFAGEIQEVIANERFDIPVDTPYTLTAGSDGAIYIVGEET